MLHGEDELDNGATEYHDYQEDREFQTSTPLHNRLNRLNIDHHQYQDQYSIKRSVSHHNQLSQRRNVKTNHSTSNNLVDPRDQMIADLQRGISQLGLENEELKHELNQAKRDIEQLAEENKILFQEKDALRQRMAEKLSYVTNAFLTLCEKLSDLKYRHYGEKNVWLNGCAVKK